MNRYNFELDAFTLSMFSRQLRWRCPWMSRTAVRSWAASLLRLAARNATSPAFYLSVSETMHRRTRRHARGTL